MLSYLIHFLNVTRLALRRLFAHRWLALSTAAGLTVAVALVMSIPLYADATHFRLLRERLVEQPVGSSYTPLAFHFNYLGRRAAGLQWDDLRPVDSYLLTEAGEALALPVVQALHVFRTDGFMLYPPFDETRPQTQYYLTWVRLALVSDLERSIRLVSGAFPAPVPAGEPLEVLVSEEVALEYGLQAGDLFITRRSKEIDIPVRISGVWAPADPKAPYWEVDSETYLLTHLDTYQDQVSPLIEDETFRSAWYLVVDGASLHAEDVGGLLERIQSVRQRVEVLLPGTQLAGSPLAELEQYQADAPTLTLLLYAFSVPILGLMLAFIGQVAGMFVAQYQNQIAILRSRGATLLHITGMAAVEGLVLGAAALALGVPAGEGVAHAIGRARSFLNFTADANLRVSLTQATLVSGLAAVGAVLLGQIVAPTIGAARRTIVTFKQERARSVRPPWWQRAWLDLLLLIPAAYGVYTLHQQSLLAASGELSVPDPLQNPMLLLVPALGIFALTLFTLRLVPWIMSLVAYAAGQSNSVGLVVAARYLSRTPASYSTPLALLVLTLSLSAFTASIATTLDRHLTRQLYYQTGGDLTLQELGIVYNETGGGAFFGRPDMYRTSQTDPVWMFNPVEEHLRLPGVRAATRVGSYTATLMMIEGSLVEARFTGIDRLTFPQAAFWQRDFSSSSLGVLMNALAAHPNNVLVSSSLLKDYGLKVGDPLNVLIRTGRTATSLKMTIAGELELFPTWYPLDGPLLVGNLDTLFVEAGSEYPHSVWLRTDPGTNHSYLARAVMGFTTLLDPNPDFSQVVDNGLNTFVFGWTSTPQEIAAVQRRPERQGLFGLLSVGFAASALLTVLGFLLYAVFSFRRRFVELGMLRAIGLSSAQLTALLAWELAFLILVGIGVGTGLGVLISRVFIPYLQVGVEAAAHYPPFIVEVAWSSIFQIYLLFGLLFLAALAALVTRLLHMKIFQAIKLGETV